MTPACAVALAMPGDERETELLGVVGAAPVCAVARRCLDIPDLLAAAHAGRLDVALIGGDVLRWDADVIARLHAHGVGVVALSSGGTGRAAFDAIGADVVVEATTTSGVQRRADEIVQALLGAAARGRERSATTDPVVRGFGHAVKGPRRPDGPAVDADPDGIEPDGIDSSGIDQGATGRLVTVWGPAGAPGRSTVALCLAQSWADAGARVLLIDADPYGGCLDQLVGLVDDEIPAIAAACRLANHGRLDPASLNELAREVRPGLSLLTGLVRADRWPELRPASLTRLWSVARILADVVVVDTGFCLEEDEELSYDTLAPRRNAATTSAVVTADVVVAVGGVDAIGLRRLSRGLDELAQVRSDGAVAVVGNRGTGKGRQIAVGREVESILLAAGHPVAVSVLPDDPVTCRRAVREGSTPLEVAPRSAFAKAVRALAQQVVPMRESGAQADPPAPPSTPAEVRPGLSVRRLRRLVG